MRTTTMGNIQDRKISLRLVVLAFTIALGSAVVAAQTPSDQCCGGMPGQGPGMMKGDPDHMADMRLFHDLLANRDKVNRTVTLRPDGIETITESDDPEMATKIRVHVAAMYKRVTNAKPIHMRDPLFRAIFENAAAIEMSHEFTPRGIKVVETSKDPYVAKLIQAHAEVVNLFIKNGMSEMMKDHPVPPREP
jgi:hypothetical protein